MRFVIEADSIATEKHSGIGYITLEIIKALDRVASKNSEVKVTIIIPKSGLNQILSYEFKAVKIIALPWKYKYWNALLTRLNIPIPADLIFRRGVYIFPNYKNWWVPFSQSITYVHDVAFKIYPDTLNKKNLSFLTSNINKWLSRADIILTDSKNSKKEIESFFPSYKQKLGVTYLFIDRNNYKKLTSQEASRVNKALSLPSKYFLHVGNLEPRKNIEALLDAYEEYRLSHNGKLPLVLIGADTWNNKKIMLRIDSINRSGIKVIRPNNYVSDKQLAGVYSSAVALISLSIHEGFGLSPLQAISCGTPVIASNIPTTREIIGNTKGVVYVESADKNYIAEKMIDIEMHSKKFKSIWETLPRDYSPINYINNLMAIINYGVNGSK